MDPNRDEIFDALERALRDAIAERQGVPADAVTVLLDRRSGELAPAVRGEAVAGLGRLAMQSARRVFMKQIREAKQRKKRK